MANIYNEDGTLDYASAVTSLKGTTGLSSPVLRDAIVGQVVAAALLDIAVSLSALTGGLAGEHYTEEDDAAVERERSEPDDVAVEVEGRLLEVGDWVRMHPVDYDDATNLEPASKVLAVGVSEGTRWVDLEHYDDEGDVLSSGVRAWAENYRLADLEPELIDETVEQREQRLDPGADIVEQRDLVDDIDNDFDESTSETTTKPKSKTKSKGKKA